MQGEKKIVLTNKESFAARIEDAQAEWERRLKKYLRMRLPKHLKDFSVDCCNKVAVVRFHPEIIARFADFIVRRKDIKRSMLELKPRRFRINRNHVFVADEPGLSIVSLMFKKACEEIIRENGNGDMLDRCKFKKKIQAVLSMNSKIRASVKVKGGGNGHFCVVLSSLRITRNGSERNITIKDMTLNDSSKRILEEVRALVKLYS